MRLTINYFRKTTSKCDFKTTVRNISEIMKYKDVLNIRNKDVPNFFNLEEFMDLFIHESI